MIKQSDKLLNQLVSTKAVEAIDHWIDKYPSKAKQSAVISTLLIVQEEQGYLSTTLMDAVAEYLEMSSIAVYEVASFYSMYEHKPVGRHIVNVCHSISCKLRGSDKIVQHLEDKLKVKLGETTSDGRYTLRVVECLGACVNAPMMQVGKNYHENLRVDQANFQNIDDIIEQYE